MATTLTVGTTGRDHSTWASGETAIPSTPTGGYELHGYNDSEFTDGVTFAGHTTSGTNYIRMTAASGQSFQDDAGARTNPLFYDRAQGVGITVDDTDGAYAIQVDEDYVTIDRLQVRRTANFYNNHNNQGLVTFSNSYPNCTIKDCILAKTYSGTNPIMRLRDSRAINVVIYDSGSTATDQALGMLEKGQAINCGIYRAGSAGGVGIVRTYTNGQNLALNCSVFGWTANFDASGGTWAGSTGYNCTNSATAPGSNNQTSKTFSNQVVSTTTDFALKTGSDCIGTGNTDATNAPNDITGFARGVGTAGDIGPWEFSSGGGGGAKPAHYYAQMRH
jgi:hypothetical protein